MHGGCGHSSELKLVVSVVFIVIIECAIQHFTITELMLAGVLA